PASIRPDAARHERMMTVICILISDRYQAIAECLRPAVHPAARLPDARGYGPGQPVRPVLGRGLRAPAAARESMTCLTRAVRADGSSAPESRAAAPGASSAPPAAVFRRFRGQRRFLLCLRLLVEPAAVFLPLCPD